jgi:hypothetical protein
MLAAFILSAAAKTSRRAGDAAVSWANWQCGGYSCQLSCRLGCSLGSHAALRAFVAGFRAARGFGFDFVFICILAAAAVLIVLVFLALVFLALTAALTGDCTSSLGCFAVRWWPWCSGWMRAASSSIRSWSSSCFWRSSTRYSGIVFVVMARSVAELSACKLCNFGHSGTIQGVPWKSKSSGDRSAMDGGGHSFLG